MKTRRLFRFFSEYDTNGIIDFLNRMGAKGWLLEKKQGIYYKFVKTDKPFVKYDITYFADADKSNNYYPYGADEYIRLRSAAGWQLVVNDQKMQIFISENPDAVPLETDAGMKVDVIHQSFLSLWLSVYLLMAVNGFIRLLDSHIDFMDVLIILAGATFMWDVCCYFIWYFKAKKAAAEGWYYETKTPFVRMYLNPIIILVMTVYLAKLIGIKAMLFFMTIFAMALFMKE